MDTSQPEILSMALLRRLDARMDRIADDIGDVRIRLTPLEVQISHLASTEVTHYSSLTALLDSVEKRLDRIEKRLDSRLPA